MQLTADLTRMLEAEESLFRAQLLREDLARLGKLQVLAEAEPDPAAFRKAGMKVGWTAGDARTHELAGPLDAFLGEVHAYWRGDRTAAREKAVSESWQALHRTRMERLLGCLSTPVPKPDG
jgi:hypothetical protein